MDCVAWESQPYLPPDVTPVGSQAWTLPPRVCLGGALAGGLPTLSGLVHEVLSSPPLKLGLHFLLSKRSPGALKTCTALLAVGMGSSAAAGALSYQ